MKTSQDFDVLGRGLGWSSTVQRPLNVVSMADAICNYRPLLMPINFKELLFRTAAMYLHDNNSEFYEKIIFKILKF